MAEERWARPMRFAAVWCVVGLSIGASAHAGGFDLGWRGARSAGMGGACVAAADPTAISCNPGALALMAKKKGAAVGFAAGAFNESLYQGLPPGIGSGSAASQKTPVSFVPHLYVTLPLGKTMVLGTGLDTPYRMHTEWNDPDAFVGRFLAQSSELNSYDLTQTFSIDAGAGVGVGGGVIFRSSDVSVTRRIDTSFGGAQREIGSLAIATDVERSLGWTFGVLVKPGPRFSFGLSHRSEMSNDYNGSGKLTQILTGDAQLDQLVAASLPFGQDLPIETRLSFPAQTTAGLAFSPSAKWLFALDATRTQWGATKGLEIVFPTTHVLDTNYTLGFEDTWTWRAGMRWKFPTGPQVRFGYAVEKTPQPDVNIGPFFPDADRTTLTAGFGLDWLDLAIGWTTYEQRIVSTSADQFNGNFRANRWTALMTVTK